MRKSLCLFFGALTIAGVVAMTIPGQIAVAADLEAGQKRAKTCTACHGKSGLSRMPLSPSLAGQPVQYLEKTMRDYRTGKREDPRMGIIARDLSDADIKNLAAWFASLKVGIIAGGS